MLAINALVRRKILVGETRQRLIVEVGASSKTSATKSSQSPLPEQRIVNKDLLEDYEAHDCCCWQVVLVLSNSSDNSLEYSKTNRSFMQAVLRMMETNPFRHAVT